MALLIDFYGALLTPRQRMCLELYFHQDLSLAEIAGELAVSRQAVHDMINRATGVLEEYETRLGLIRMDSERRRSVADILAVLDRLEAGCRTCQDGLTRIRRLVTHLA